MVIRMRDPFAALAAVHRSMDSAVRNEWFGTRASGNGTFPLLNAFRRGEDFAIVAELPGVKKEDLSIEVKGDTVRIRGKKTIAYDENVSVHRRERAEGEFDRTLTLPAQIEVAKVTAEFRGGVLTLNLPRAQSEKARSVAIN